MRELMSVRMRHGQAERHDERQGKSKVRALAKHASMLHPPAGVRNPPFVKSGGFIGLRQITLAYRDETLRKLNGMWADDFSCESSSWSPRGDMSSGITCRSRGSLALGTSALQKMHAC